MTRFVLMLTLAVGTSLSADVVGDLRQKLAQETHPAKRAKLTVKLGEQLLQQARKAYADGAYTDGDAALEDYRTALRTAVNDLRESGRNARRKPKGFKALEIHLRRSHRKLDDMARTLPFDVRDTAQSIVNELQTWQTQLLRALMGVQQPEGNKGEP